MKHPFFLSLLLFEFLIQTPQSFAELCPDIASLKAKKLSLEWREIEPSILNAETFEWVKIDQNDVTCEYSSYFDKEIRVMLKGKMFPVKTADWFKRRGEAGLFCNEEISSCEFKKYDPDQLNEQLEEIRQRQSEKQAGDSEESEDSAGASPKKDEAPAKKSESKYGVTIY